jgi:hypothetical protein
MMRPAPTLHPGRSKVNRFTSTLRKTSIQSGDQCRQRRSLGSMRKAQFDEMDGLCTCVTLFGGVAEDGPLAGVPGCCGAYFDAHFACSALA